MSKTYDIDELAKGLRFTKPYVKMNLKKFPEYKDGDPISEELAQKIAAMLRRPWPPEPDEPEAA